jgi:hypothetical protein
VQVVVQVAVQVEEFKQQTLRKLADVRCPDHHKPPHLEFHGSTLRDVTIRMKACCEKLATLANRRIAGQ